MGSHTHRIYLSLSSVSDSGKNNQTADTGAKEKSSETGNESNKTATDENSTENKLRGGGEKSKMFFILM